MRDRNLMELIGTPERKEVAYDALMPRRVGNLLLVSSLYDCFTFIEDGKFSEMLVAEYLDLELKITPSIERVSTAEEALERLAAEPFDLVISMARVGDMDVREFSRAAKKIAPALPIVLLASNTRELEILRPPETPSAIDMEFVWLGDVRLFLAIIKQVEDASNALHDARTAGVRSIVLVEDSVQFYSSYLPMLYTEIFNQTHSLAESANRAQRLMRLRGRPKVLLARTYEEGMGLCGRYQDYLLGMIIDAAFPSGGKLDPCAGFRFAKYLKEKAPEVPVLMQSDPDAADCAHAAGLSFVDKNSPTLFAELRQFMKERLGFGDYVLTAADGTTLSRAADLRTLEWAFQAVPEEHFVRNVTRSDLYRWLQARSEFELAENLRSTAGQPGNDPKHLRGKVLRHLREHREQSVAGIVTEYSKKTFTDDFGFVRIGNGSLGGKGRGLAFIHSLIYNYGLENRFPGARILVPPTAVLATGIFDQLMDSSGLLSFALKEPDDEKITQAFLEAELPQNVTDGLWHFLHWVRCPLAVRSSSLLEDASYQPFAGIYKTFMIPNNHEDAEVRLQELCSAVKRVYASTYQSDPKAYMDSVAHRLEEEKMAVIIQQVVGKPHGQYFYPNLAGVGRSVNFYPIAAAKPEDGVVSLALGLGKTVVDGGRCFRFCPVYPQMPIQSLTPREYLENSQQDFLALDLSRPAFSAGSGSGRFADLVSLGLEMAEEHGTLQPVASVFSADNEAIYAGLSRPGVRLVTMAGVLKCRELALAEVTDFLLKVGTAAASCPVEIEFAVNLAGSADERHEFAFLQIRPLVLGSELQDINVEEHDLRNALCISHKALGNGVLQGISDILYVKPRGLDRSATARIAQEIEILNAQLKQSGRSYLLIGPGRWGSADPWLGIPVKWAQISSVRCIVETGFEDISVEPSQGSHFFQNIMSFGIGYFIVDHKQADDLLDFAQLEARRCQTETDHVRHISLEQPLRIVINGRKNFGIISVPR